jgi:hypothetical protein
LRGVPVESAAPEKQNVAKSQFPAVNMLLAVSTTLVVGLEVGRHWGSYGWFNKFIGVILVLSLLGSLLELVRKKEKIAVEGFVTSAYMCLMLATILFGN